MRALTFIFTTFLALSTSTYILDALHHPFSYTPLLNLQPSNKLRLKDFSKMAHQFPKPHAKPYVDHYNHANASVAGIKVLQYRSYQRDLHTYHLRLHLLPLPMVYRVGRDTSTS